MALSSQSLLVYGIQVTSLNNLIDFKTTSGGATKTATLNLGYYSPTSLAIEAVRALSAADNSVTYTANVLRGYDMGIGNRMQISTSSSFFSLLFSSGPNTINSAYSLFGFAYSDYTGHTSYTGYQSTGTTLVPAMIGYNYTPIEINMEVQGATTVSASGVKEAVVFQVMQFAGVEFKYEPKSSLSSWSSFFQWSIQQRPFEFMPEISNPSYIYEVTLDKSTRGSKGMGIMMKEMLPQFPNYYTTGALEFRKIQ